MQMVVAWDDVDVVAVRDDDGGVIVEMARVVPDARGMAVTMSMPVTVTVAVSMPVPMTVPVRVSRNVNAESMIADMDAKAAAADDASGLLAGGHPLDRQVKCLATCHGKSPLVRLFG